MAGQPARNRLSMIATQRGDALYEIHNTDAIEWLAEAPSSSVHAVVTDPPYGLVEYRQDQLAKRRSGSGGIWRIPPSFDGYERSAVPRFTVLTQEHHDSLTTFFGRLADQLLRVLVPGGHVLIATNPLLSQFVYLAFINAGFEKRGEVVRLVQTLRGGDRPKGAHLEFAGVSTMPRSCWEPWGLLRKPCEGRVYDNLRKWQAGGLRRLSDEVPFKDVIAVSPARGEEKRIAPHPSLKPQRLMRPLVRALLPLGEGIVLDPFMGSGATIAAACACGIRSIGIEADHDYFKMAQRAIPRIARLEVERGDGS